MKACPLCAEAIQEAAVVCRFCGARETGSGWQPPESPPSPHETNGLAIASFALGLVWMYWIGSVLALVLGYRAKRQIDASGGRQTGRGLALAGIVLGWLGVAGAVALAISFAFVLSLEPSVPRVSGISADRTDVNDLRPGMCFVGSGVQGDRNGQTRFVFARPCRGNVQQVVASAFLPAESPYPGTEAIQAAALAACRARTAEQPETANVPSRESWDRGERLVVCSARHLCLQASSASTTTTPPPPPGRGPSIAAVHPCSGGNAL